MSVACLAARGDIFRSCRAVIRGLKFLEKGDIHKSDQTGNKWTELFAFQYVYELQKVFNFDNLSIPMLSMAWDAIRISKMDC